MKGNSQPEAGDTKNWRESTETVLATRERERIAAVAAAEAAARALVEAINTVFDCSAEEQRLFSRLGRPAPLAITDQALASRLGERLAAVLAEIERHPARLGPVVWYGTWRSAKDDWSKQEAAEMRNATG